MLTQAQKKKVVATRVRKQLAALDNPGKDYVPPSKRTRGKKYAGQKMQEGEQEVPEGKSAKKKKAKSKKKKN